MYKKNSQKIQHERDINIKFSSKYKEKIFVIFRKNSE